MGAYLTQQFRRLHQVDVQQKLKIIAERAIDDGVIEYATVRVDREIMIVRYLKNGASLRDGAATAGTVSTWSAYPDIVKTISYAEPCVTGRRISSLGRTVQRSHPNVVQFYGRSASHPEMAFAVFRSGEFVSQLRYS